MKESLKCKVSEKKAFLFLLEIIIPIEIFTEIMLRHKFKKGSRIFVPIFLQAFLPRIWNIYGVNGAIPMQVRKCVH